jgi:hypothetical protein
MADDDIAVDQGTETPDTPMVSNEPSDTGTAQPDTQDGGGSSTTVQPDQTQPNAASPDQDPTKQANPWDTDDNPYRKRFNDALSHGTKLYQEVQKYRKQFDGIDPEQARKALEMRKQQEEASKLKPWNKGHEAYDKFQAVRSRVSEYNRMRQAADTPEKQSLLKEMAGQMFRPEELQQVQDYETDRAQMVAQLTEDPRGFINDLVAPLIQQSLAQFEQFQAARQQTTSWFTDPNNQPLLDRYAPDMYRMMDPSVPARDKAIEVARLKSENDALKARLSGQIETLATAEAQMSARRGQATTATRRSPATTTITDPYAHLERQGMRPGTVEFAIALQRLNNP